MPGILTRFDAKQGSISLILDNVEINFHWSDEANDASM